ncbi:LysR family transcriptional regulator [Undibacterium luofuense]|uniref:LysR family transcriptional regulator n=1 Tax=Undibacterium luofuense TaxID=2828733 RepID=UPI0030EE4A1B
MRLPSLRLLAGFEAAARLGHFSRAAEELNLSQSAISHQIQQLEQELGQPLFHRVGRGVELTVAGQALLRTVQTSLHGLENGIRRISTYLAPGLVTVVCPAAAAQGWLQPAVTAMQKTLTGLLPVISVDESARFIDELDVDLLISDTPLQQADTQSQILFQDQWIVVTRAEESATRNTTEDTSPQPLTLVCLEQSFSDPVCGDVLMQALGKFPRSMICDDERLVLQRVLQGQTLALLPLSTCWHLLQQGQLVQRADLPSLPGKTWWIARKQGDTRDPLVRQCHDAICEFAQTLAAPALVSR